MRLVHGDHLCSVCESSCDQVTDLKRRVRLLERENFALAFALVEERTLRASIDDAIEERFPEGEAA